MRHLWDKDKYLIMKEFEDVFKLLDKNFLYTNLTFL